MKLAIINKDQQYSDDLEAFCDKNCVLQVLNYYGVSSPLFYIESAVNIHLFEDKTKPIGYNVDFDRSNVMERYKSKVKIHIPSNQTKEQVWEENRAILREGIPVITGIDIFYLDYSSNYNRYHSNHKCILGGYSSDGKYASIIDCYEWKYKGNVLLNDFLTARSSLCPVDDSPYSGYPIGNEWITVEDSSWTINIREAVRETVNKVVKNYYENGETNYKTEFYGLAALKKMYELFKDCKDINEEEITKLIANVRIIFLFLYTRKKLFRYYIKEAVNYLNISLLSDVLTSLNEDLELFRKTTILMLKVSMCVTDNGCNKIENRMKELIELEEKRYHLLSQLSLNL